MDIEDFIKPCAAPVRCCGILFAESVGGAKSVTTGGRESLAREFGFEGAIDDGALASPWEEKARA